MKQNPLQESPRKPQEFREPLPRNKELTFTHTQGSESNEFKWHESSSSSEEQVSIVTVTSKTEVLQTPSAIEVNLSQG